MMEKKDILWLIEEMHNQLFPRGSFMEPESWILRPSYYKDLIKIDPNLHRLFDELLITDSNQFYRKNEDIMEICEIIGAQGVIDAINMRAKHRSKRDKTSYLEYIKAYASKKDLIEFLEKLFYHIKEYIRQYALSYITIINQIIDNMKKKLMELDNSISSIEFYNYHTINSDFSYITIDIVIFALIKSFFKRNFNTSYFKSIFSGDNIDGYLEDQYKHIDEAIDLIRDLHDRTLRNKYLTRICTNAPSNIGTYIQAIEVNFQFSPSTISLYEITYKDGTKRAYQVQYLYRNEPEFFYGGPDPGVDDSEEVPFLREYACHLPDAAKEKLYGFHITELNENCKVTCKSHYPIIYHYYNDLIDEYYKKINDVDSSFSPIENKSDYKEGESSYVTTSMIDHAIYTIYSIIGYQIPGKEEILARNGGIAPKIDIVPNISSHYRCTFNNYICSMYSMQFYTLYDHQWNYRPNRPCIYRYLRDLGCYNKDTYVAMMDCIERSIYKCIKNHQLYRELEKVFGGLQFTIKPFLDWTPPGFPPVDSTVHFGYDLETSEYGHVLTFSSGHDRWSSDLFYSILPIRVGITSDDLIKVGANRAKANKIDGFYGSKNHRYLVNVLYDRLNDFCVPEENPRLNYTIIQDLEDSGFNVIKHLRNFVSDYMDEWFKLESFLDQNGTDVFSDVVYNGNMDEYLSKIVYYCTSYNYRNYFTKVKPFDLSKMVAKS